MEGPERPATSGRALTQRIARPARDLRPALSVDAMEYVVHGVVMPFTGVFPCGASCDDKATGAACRGPYMGMHNPPICGNPVGPWQVSVPDQGEKA